MSLSVTLTLMSGHITGMPWCLTEKRVDEVAYNVYRGSSHSIIQDSLKATDKELISKCLLNLSCFYNSKYRWVVTLSKIFSLSQSQNPRTFLSLVYAKYILEIHIYNIILIAIILRHPVLEILIKKCQSWIKSSSVKVLGFGMFLTTDSYILPW